MILLALACSKSVNPTAPVPRQDAVAPTLEASPAPAPETPLPSGMAALTLTHAVPPPLRPGNYVDVLVTETDRTTVAFQALFILACPTPTTTTVMVTTAQADAWPDGEARRKQVHLAVRHDDDLQVDALEDHVPETTQAP